MPWYSHTGTVFVEFDHQSFVLLDAFRSSCSDHYVRVTVGVGRVEPNCGVTDVVIEDLAFQQDVELRQLGPETLLVNAPGLSRAAATQMVTSARWQIAAG